MLREQFSCFAIDLTPSPLRAITRISTASSWVNIDGTKKAVILAQVGHSYFGAVVQYYFGGNSFAPFGAPLMSNVRRHNMAENVTNPFAEAYIAKRRAPKRAPIPAGTAPVQVAFSPTLEADLANWQRSGYSCIGLSDVVSKAGMQGVSRQLEEQALRVGAQVVLFCVWPAKLKSVRREVYGTIDLEAVVADPPAGFSPRGYAVARALFLAPKRSNKGQ